MNFVATPTLYLDPHLPDDLAKPLRSIKSKRALLDRARKEILELRAHIDLHGKVMARILSEIAQDV